MGLLKYVVVAILLAGLALAGGGCWLLVQRETGTRTEATVTSCQDFGAGRSGETDCSGSWVVGGSLLAGGHVVVGTVNGVGHGDVGKQVSVTLSGGTAYSRSLAEPLVLLALGLVILAGGGLLLRAVRKPA